MKRKHTTLIGNVLMGIGLVGMVGGVALAVASYSPELSIASHYSHSGIIAIFIGAFIWLIGARFSGFERVEDRYWYVRHLGKRSQHRRV